jgi:galactonate dehydratase
VKISKIETIRIAEHPNLLWVEITTDEGITGLGETFFGARAVEAYIHETAAPLLMGRDPLEIDRISKELAGYLAFIGAGAEMRGNSAIDIALWDIFGKFSGQPIAQLLGGFTRREIRTYNTCAGTTYMKAGGQTVANYGLADTGNRYADLDAFLNRADDLAEDLLSEGISAMKIWPFDMAAEATGGRYIDQAALKSALVPFEKIRNRVSDRMEIMVEFHAMWQLLPALEIARALAPFRTFWHEDPIRMDSLADLKRYAQVSTAPLCASETLSTRWRFKDLLLTDAAGVVMLDLSWCGGLSEAKKIATMAEAWRLPVAPHDCTGPVVLCASTHLSLNAPNALIQESVRAFYRTWYGDIVTALPAVRNGMITVPPGAGLGMALNPDLDTKFAVTRQVTATD